MVDTTQRADSGSEGITRRSLTRTAAWSVPALAVAIAAPAATASLASATVAFTGANTSLNINLLTGTVLTAAVLVTRPTGFTITNTGSAIPAETVSGATITIALASGVVTGVLSRPRTFGVFTVNGVAPVRTELQPPITLLTPPSVTTATFSFDGGVAANSSLTIPVEFGITNEPSILGLNVLATYLVTLTLPYATRTLTATGTITLPLGAGLL